MTGRRLRPATADDAPAVTALEADLFGADAWSAAQVLDELTGPGRAGWVAAEGSGVVVGYVITWQVADVVDLQRIAVVPGHRRTGLAHALLAAATDAAAASGADRTLLEVSAANPGALAFYEREGFTVIGRRRAYYRDGADAMVLERPL